MAEQTEENTPEEGASVTRRYNVDLGGNRGKTVMKLNAKHAEERGLTDADLVEGEEPQPSTKSKASSNKAKSASNK